MTSQKIRDVIYNRDAGECWHCGTTEGLTIHHRANRGMGGQKKELADRPSNLILLCTWYNVAIESDLTHAREARERGIKLRRGFDSLTTPVRRYDGSEWYLTDVGTKIEKEDTR